MSAGGRQTELVADRTNQFFGRGVVDAERSRGHQHLGALRAECRHGVLDGFTVQPVAEQELVAGLQHATRRKLDRINANLRLGELRGLGARKAENADAGDVAFQQRVGGLRGAVREQDDIGSIDAGIAQHAFEHFDHARGNAVRVIMGGVNGRTPDHAAVDVVDQGGLGESPSDVDSDAIGILGQGCVHYPFGPAEAARITR